MKKLICYIYVTVLIVLFVGCLRFFQIVINETESSLPWHDGLEPVTTTELKTDFAILARLLVKNSNSVRRSEFTRRFLEIYGEIVGQKEMPSDSMQKLYAKKSLATAGRLIFHFGVDGQLVDIQRLSTSTPQKELSDSIMALPKMSFLASGSNYIERLLSMEAFTFSLLPLAWLSLGVIVSYVLAESQKDLDAWLFSDFVLILCVFCSFLLLSLWAYYSEIGSRALLLNSNRFGVLKVLEDTRNNFVFPSILIDYTILHVSLLFWTLFRTFKMTRGCVRSTR